MTQSNGSGSSSVPIEPVIAIPENVYKRKASVKHLGDHAFRETGKLEYGSKIGKMATAGGYNLELMPSRSRTGGLYLRVHPSQPCTLCSGMSPLSL